jgi:hypothetical protein
VIIVSLPSRRRNFTAMNALIAAVFIAPVPIATTPHCRISAAGPAVFAGSAEDVFRFRQRFIPPHGEVVKNASVFHGCRVLNAAGRRAATL